MDITYKIKFFVSIYDYIYDIKIKLKIIVFFKMKIESKFKYSIQINTHYQVISKSLTKCQRIK